MDNFELDINFYLVYTLVTFGNFPRPLARGEFLFKDNINS